MMGGVVHLRHPGDHRRTSGVAGTSTLAKGSIDIVEVPSATRRTCRPVRGGYRPCGADVLEQGADASAQLARLPRSAESTVAFVLLGHGGWARGAVAAAG